MNFKPQLFSSLKNYSLKNFSSDLQAGIIVAIVALPLAIAFAIASGVSPERGLVTAVVAGFLISALGGSRVQIGGPTGAFIVLVYHVVSRFGMEGLLIATFLAGVLLVIMGLAGFGGAIKFFPYPVIVGFTGGIALLIFSSQIKDMLGLEMGPVPAEFLEKWASYLHAFPSINPYAVVLSLGTILIIFLWKRVSLKIPGALVALIFFTICVQLFHLPVETIGSRFGSIPQSFPAPVLPAFSLEMLRELYPSIIAIALLAAIESLLSAVIADGRIGSRHDSNTELVGQGIANMASALFGGMPATGAIARTTTNIQNGGKTPMAGIIHAFALLAIMLFLGKWAVYIPLACLAGILVVVAYHMSEWHSFLMIFKCPKSDIAVLMTTFLLTVIVDLTVAIEAGILLAGFLFMRRMALEANVDVITPEQKGTVEPHDLFPANRFDIPKGVQIYEVGGPLFFGAAYKFVDVVKDVSRAPKVRIIRMRQVNAIDATGLQALKEAYHSSRKQGTAFILSGVRIQPLMAMERSGLAKLIGQENIFTRIEDALDAARKIVHDNAEAASSKPS